MKREEAKQIIKENVKNEGLRRHCLGVAACMEKYAEKSSLDEEEKNKWWICGMLHDFDLEIHPSLEGHPSEGVKILRESGVDEDICVAIMGHDNHTSVARESLMTKTLFAVDELSGLVVALAHVRRRSPENMNSSGPKTLGNQERVSGFEGMSPKSLKKKIKNKEFAAAINREGIKQGIWELGVDLDEHYQLVIDALNGIKGRLGFG